MLRASYSFARVRASAQRAAVSLAYNPLEESLRASYSFVQLSASARDQRATFAPESASSSFSVMFADLKAGLEYISMAASYHLMTETLNQYLNFAFEVSDLATLDVTKSPSDVTYINDEISLSYTLPTEDTVSVSDIFTKSVGYNRSLTEATSVADEQVLVFDLVKADLAALSDIEAKGVAKSITEAASLSETLLSDFNSAKSDSFFIADVVDISVGFFRDFVDSYSLTEIQAISYSTNKDESIAIADDPEIETIKSQQDSASVLETLSITTQYSRQFSDAFTLDDLANIGDLEKNTSLDKGNVFSMSEAIAFQAQKAVSDTLAMQEALAKSFSASAADALSISEVLSTDSAKSITESLSVIDSPALSTETTAQDNLSVGDSLTLTLVSGSTVSSRFNNSAFNAFAFNE